jgi:hypothetical protein
MGSYLASALSSYRSAKSTPRSSSREVLVTSSILMNAVTWVSHMGHSGDLTCALMKFGEPWGSAAQIAIQT